MATKRLIQIIDGAMRDIEVSDGDVTVSPPGSEIISEETMDSFVAMRSLPPQAHVTRADIEDRLITARGLRDERQNGGGTHTPPSRRVA